MEIKRIDNIEEIIKDIIENKIPFNKVIGFRINDIQNGKISIKFSMKDDLVGNYYFGILHGGVIASALDLVGGVTAFYALLNKYRDLLFEEKIRRLSTLGTIDLRVDYLRPGKGDWFIASSKILRLGRKVAVSRMELINDKKEVIAVGTGTYNVG